MKSLRYYSLLAFALSLAATASAADFGDIPASLALPAGTSVRRNAGNTGFESFTPGSGSGTVTDFSAGTLSPLFTTSVATSTTTPALTFSLSNSAAHTFFANNTGSTGAPSFTSFVAGTDYWDTTVFPGGAAIGLVPQVPGTFPACIRFLNENGIWQCSGSGGSSGGAPDDAHYLTTQSESALTNEFNLGGLASGILKQTVSTGVATPAIAGSADVIGLFTGCSGTQYLGADGACHNAASGQNYSVTFVVDGAGGVLTTGTKNPIKIAYGGTLTGWLLIGKPSGSVTVDIFRAADGAGLPVTSIVGGGTKPALSSAVEASSTSFTSWTSTTLTAKDNLAISLSGVSTATYCALTLYYQ